ncbi:MAG TPA: CHAT domain-containing tetratricopeptide repeat protein [Thermoanaerobaculia bacterium]
MVRLTDPTGKVATGVDGLLGGEANENLAFVAADGSTYTLEVKAPAGPKAGRYRLRVEAIGEPREQDRLRAQAVRATWDGFLAPGLSVEDRIRSLERALSLWREIGDSGKSAEVLYGLGLKRFDSLKAYGQALPNFQQSAQLWSEQTGRAARVFQARSLTYMARCLRHSERREEARQAHERALALARDLDETGLEAENLNVLGRLDVEEGEVRKGVDRHLQALKLARKAGDRALEARVFNNLAVGYEHLAEMQKALESYQQALDLARSSKDREAELIYLNNLGDTYQILGDWKKAFDHYRRCIELGRLVRNRKLEGTILINLAGAYLHLGQIDDARSSLDSALALGRQIDSREVQTFALGNLALFLLQSKRPAEAVEHARKAVGLGGSIEEETFSRYVLGRALRDAGDTAQARTELTNALALAHRRGALGTEAEINLTLARMDRDGGDLPAALSRIQTAIELIESRRNRVISPELRTSFLASKQDYYELQVDTLMALHEKRPTEGFAAEALQASEQARARGLLDILNEAGADIGLGADPALVEKERQAREQVNARDWYRRELLAQEDPDREKVVDAEQRLGEALDALQKVQVKRRESSPRYAALIQPQPLEVAEIQRQVLDGEALLLEYSLGAKRSFLWAVAPDSLASFELPGRDKIEQAARRYYKLLTVRNNRLPGEPVPAWKKRIIESDAEAERTARELSQLILGPAEKLLGRRTLLIVADGALQYIPFAALPIPASETPLATRHEVVNLPSASVLAVMRRELHGRPPAPRLLAIFADPVFQKDDKRLLRDLGKPDQIRLTQASLTQRGGGLEESQEKGVDLSTLHRLTFSQKEADTIAALVPPSEVFKAVGFAASRTAVAGCGLGGYRNVHFATHGVLDSHHPELSGLVLSLYDERGERQDGFLRLNDIYSLRLNADLIVLSACKTALGKEIRGEGLVGLTRGFMYAGAARVLASLWSVEDRATAELMGSFYRGMLRDGLSPAAALRRAQLEMSRTAAWKSPYFWAGFSLQGEWRW